MEKFVTKHSRVILIVLAALVCVTVGLVTFLYFDFTAHRKGEEYTDYVAEVEMKNYARELFDALGADDGVLAYHDAEMAAYHASMCGKENEAAFFHRISAYLVTGEADLLAIKAEVGHFLEEGETSGIDSSEVYYDDNSESTGAIFEIKLESAKDSANGIFGLTDTLKPVTKSTDGSLVFACENAYAVIDEVSGLPIEAGISVSCGEPILSSLECETYAREFLKKCFSKEAGEDAALIECYPEDDGVYGMVFRFHDTQVVMSVKQDTGRVVRMHVE